MHFVHTSTAAYSLNILLLNRGHMLLFPHRKSKQSPLCGIPQLGDHNCILNGLLYVLTANFSYVAT